MTLRALGHPPQLGNRGGCRASGRGQATPPRGPSTPTSQVHAPVALPMSPGPHPRGPPRPSAPHTPSARSCRLAHVAGPLSTRSPAAFPLPDAPPWGWVSSPSLWAALVAVARCCVQPPVPHRHCSILQGRALDIPPSLSWSPRVIPARGAATPPSWGSQATRSCISGAPPLGSTPAPHGDSLQNAG